MAHKVLNDATILVANYDISGQTNNIGLLPVNVVSLDSTNFASGGWNANTPGLKSAGGSGSGFFSDENFDLDQLTGLTNVPISLTDDNPIAEGDRLWGYQSNQTEFNPGWTVGELQAWAGSFVSTGSMAQGFALHTGAETATGASAGQNLGAVAATQYIFGWMHVYAVAGTSPTLDVLIESDATDSWSGAETTRFTFTQETDATANYQWATPVLGAVTDTWWRASYTITGSAGQSFTFVTGFAIL